MVDFKEPKHMREIFVENFYLDQLQGGAPDDAYEHFCKIGWKLGWDPAPDFSTARYLTEYGDVRSSGMNPLEHFVKFGRDEGRKKWPSKRIDENVRALMEGGSTGVNTARAVLEVYRPVSGQPLANPTKLKDYLYGGWRNGRVLSDEHFGVEPVGSNMERCISDEDKQVALSASEVYRLDEDLVSVLNALMVSEWYEAQCASLGILVPEAVGLKPVDHFLTFGRFFRLSITPVFDVSFYVGDEDAPQSKQIAPEMALIHYASEGRQLGHRPSAFFNPDYYSLKYGVEIDSALLHYVEVGAALDYQPSAVFWSSWYRETYDVAIENPLIHFNSVGMEEGACPNPLLDLEYYRQQCKLGNRKAALERFVSKGFLADASPSMLIEPNFIRSQTTEAGVGIGAEETAFEFYVRNARSISPCMLFDTRFYLSMRDEGAEIAQPLWHYLDREVDGHKQPNPYFIDAVYEAHRADVRDASMVPLIHYCRSGEKETVKTHPLVDHDVLPKGSVTQTPIAALLTGEAGDTVRVRRGGKRPDSENRSKWLPVALDIDLAAAKDDGVAIDQVRVGILAHVFYVELISEVVEFAKNCPENSVLLVSTDTVTKKQAIVACLEQSHLKNWDVRVFENRGRDVAPSFLGFVDRLEELDYAVHIHTKQSHHYGQSFDKWRKFLYAENGGSHKRVTSILKTFESNPTLGALAPVDFGPIRKLISWGYNQQMVEGLLSLAGCHVDLSKTSLEFPSGTMFWFRTKALKGLFKAGLRRFHFDSEAGQVDGTLAHAIERGMFLLIEAAGYDWARFCSGGKLGGYNVTSNIKFARSRLLPPNVLKDPIAQKLPETAPFFCQAIENKRPRLNLLIPTADQQMGYAGVSEAIRQFRAIGEELSADVDLRIISTDVPFDNMTIPPSGFSVSETLVDDQSMVVVPGVDRGSHPIALRENDIFVASAWWNAKHSYALMEEQARLFGENVPRRMVYLIQDFEPGFYPWSTRWAQAENTYRHPEKTIAVFNTPLLAEFMTERYKFNAHVTFRPMINESLLVPKGDQLPADKREKIMLLYARPHAERNCLEMIDATIFHCVNENPEFWADWRFLAIGENFKSDLLVCDRIEVLGRLSLETYRDLLARAMLGLSMMVSPHPSYPPLEMAANGVKVVTNSYENKDLSKIHENLESFTFFDPGHLAERLCEMAKEVKLPGKPLVDWFFEGGNNLKDVAQEVAEQIQIDLDANRPQL